MRTLKELLIVLRDNAEIEPFGIKRNAMKLGLCYQVTVLRQNGKMNIEESSTVKNFIELATKKKNSVYFPFMYKPGNWTYRKRWLNKQIKLLDEQERQTGVKVY